MKGFVFLILLVGVVFLSISVIAYSGENINQCMNLNVNDKSYVINESLTYVSGCFNITGNNITLDCNGSYIVGIDNGIGIHVKNTTNVTIKNCIIINWSNGILINNSAHVSLINNTISNNSVRGIHLYNRSNYNKIVNNTVNNNYQGIYLSLDSNYNNVTECIVSNNSDAGIRLSFSEHISISAIQAYNNSRGIFLFNSGDINIYRCEVWNNSQGIVLHNGNLSKIMDNDLQNNEYGIVLNSSCNNIINNSVIVGNVGIDIHESTENHIYNNLFNNSLNVNFSGSIYRNLWNTTKHEGSRIRYHGINVGGNFWAISVGNGFSEICNDSDYDGFCDSNYTITTNNTDYLPLSDDYDEFAITLLYPEIANITNNQTIEFVFKANSSYHQVFSCTLYIDEVNTSKNDRVKNYTITTITADLDEGAHNWSVSCGYKHSEKRKIVVDITAPAINLSQPENNTNTTENVTLIANTSDLSGIKNVSLYLNGTFNATIDYNDSSAASHSVVFNINNLVGGIWIWYLRVCDIALNCNNSETWIFTVTTTTTTTTVEGTISQTGGGGGGGNANIITPTWTTCFDGIQNQGEEDVDCGGPCKPCVTTTTTIATTTVTTSTLPEPVEHTTTIRGDSGTKIVKKGRIVGYANETQIKEENTSVRKIDHEKAKTNFVIETIKELPTTVYNFFDDIYNIVKSNPVGWAVPVMFLFLIFYMYYTRIYQSQGNYRKELKRLKRSV